MPPPVPECHMDPGPPEPQEGAGSPSALSCHARGEAADVTTGCRHQRRAEKLDNGGSAVSQIEV